MATVYGAHLSPAQKELELIILEGEIERKQIEAMQYIMEASTAAAYLEAERDVLANYGSIYDLDRSFLAVEAENGEKEEGIISKIGQWVIRQINRFTKWINDTFGKKGENIPDECELDEDTYNRSNALINAWNNIKGSVTEKIGDNVTQVIRGEEVDDSWIKNIQTGATNAASQIKGMVDAAKETEGGKKVRKYSKAAVSKISTGLTGVMKDLSDLQKRVMGEESEGDAMDESADDMLTDEELYLEAAGLYTSVDQLNSKNINDAVDKLIKVTTDTKAHRKAGGYIQNDDGSFSHDAAIVREIEDALKAINDYPNKQEIKNYQKIKMVSDTIPSLKENMKERPESNTNTSQNTKRGKSFGKGNHSFSNSSSQGGSQSSQSPETGVGAPEPTNGSANSGTNNSSHQENNNAAPGVGASSRVENLKAGAKSAANKVAGAMDKAADKVASGASAAFDAAGKAGEKAADATRQMIQDTKDDIQDSKDQHVANQSDRAARRANRKNQKGMTDEEKSDYQSKTTWDADSKTFKAPNVAIPDSKEMVTLARKGNIDQIDSNMKKYVDGLTSTNRKISKQEAKQAYDMIDQLYDEIKKSGKNSDELYEKYKGYKETINGYVDETKGATGSQLLDDTAGQIKNRQDYNKLRGDRDQVSKTRSNLKSDMDTFLANVKKSTYKNPVQEFNKLKKKYENYDKIINGSDEYHKYFEELDTTLSNLDKDINDEIKKSGHAKAGEILNRPNMTKDSQGVLDKADKYTSDLTSSKRKISNKEKNEALNAINNAMSNLQKAGKDDAAVKRKVGEYREIIVKAVDNSVKDLPTGDSAKAFNELVGRTPEESQNSDQENGTATGNNANASGTKATTPKEKNKGLLRTIADSVGNAIRGVITTIRGLLLSLGRAIGIVKDTEAVAESTYYESVEDESFDSDLVSLDILFGSI